MAQGVLENDREVAVKMLKNLKRDINDFEREISLVADLRHDNILKLFGHCFEGERRFLIYEFAANNSLQKLLYKATTL